MRKRYPNPRLAKSILTYDVAEMAHMYGCHRNTVRNWLRMGLEPIDDRRPILVRGDVLNLFHLTRKQAAKRPCAPGEIYCPPCGTPKLPSDELVDAVRLNEKVWLITGLCPDCGRSISQRVGHARLVAFRSFQGFVERSPTDD